MYRLTGRLEQSQLADLFRGERTEAGESVVLKLFHLKTSDAASAVSEAALGASLTAYFVTYALMFGAYIVVLTHLAGEGAGAAQKPMAGGPGLAAAGEVR